MIKYQNPKAPFYLCGFGPNLLVKFEESIKKNIMPSPAESKIVPCSLKKFFLYFLELGTFGFGGPIALAGYMQRDLLEKKRWISKEDTE